MTPAKYTKKVYINMSAMDNPYDKPKAVLLQPIR